VNDLKGVKRIKALVNDIKVRPLVRPGKPESLKYQKQGYWCRRIDKVNRLF